MLGVTGGRNIGILSSHSLKGISIAHHSNLPRWQISRRRRDGVKKAFIFLRKISRVKRNERFAYTRYERDCIRKNIESNTFV